MESISEMEAELNAYPWVEIAREGSFKFVMVKVILRSKQYKFKTLVSGCKTVESHNDLFKMVAHRIHRDGFNSEYLGGGYMEHIPTEKKINIYAGITGDFGMARQVILLKVLRKKYTNYTFEFM